MSDTFDASAICPGGLLIHLGLYLVHIRFAHSTDVEWPSLKAKETRLGSLEPDKFGITDYARLEILISPHIQRGRVRTVLYHEIAHFMIWLIDGDNSEAAANLIGAILMESGSFERQVAALEEDWTDLHQKGGNQ